MKSTLFTGLSGLAFTAGALTSTPVLAQSAEDDSGSAVALVQEIIVTAQRREERLVDVPISVSALPAEALVSAGVRTTLDIPKLVPGMEVSHNGAWVTPAIRGVFSRVGENSVAQYVDGVFIPNPVTALNEFAAVERVDVLKGPQGTLFGRNATGGAIMIETPDPDSDAFDARLSVSAEERDGYGATGYFNFPVSESFALNLALNYRESDGWIEEGVNTLPTGSQALPAGTPLNSIEHSGQRVKLLWTPDERTRVLATYWHGELRDPGAVVYPARSNTLMGQVGPLPRNVALANWAPINRAKFDQASLRFERDIGDLTFSSLTAYRDDHNYLAVDVGQTLNPPVFASWDSAQHTFSQEFILQGSIGAFEPVFGLFVYDDEFTKAYLSANQVTVQEAFSVAPFVDVTWHLTDNFSLIGGLRYTYEKREFDYRRPISGPELVAFSKEKTYDDLSPRLVAKYDFGGATNVYASVTRGFKSGMFNNDATGLAGPDVAAAQPLEAEEITTYELGFKRSTSAYSFATAAFYYDWKDIQVNRYLNGNTVAQNAAAAEIYGIEAQLSYRFTPDFELYANGTWLHGRYSDFPDGNASVQAGAGDRYDRNDRTSPLVVLVSQDWTDQRLLLAPDWSFNAGFNWQIPLPLGELRVSPNVRYTSEYATSNILLDTSGRNVLAVDARTLVDMTVSYAPTDRFEIAAYARNLFDKEYIAEPNYNALGMYGLWGEPRTVGVRFSYDY